MDWKKIEEDFEKSLPEDWDEREKELDKLFHINPRDYFVELLLLKPMLEVETFLYEGKWRECVGRLQGVIASLDQKGHETLNLQWEELLSFDEGVPCSKETIEQIKKDVLEYLRDNWFQNTIFGRR